MTKRFVSAVLVCVIVLSLCAIPVSAAETGFSVADAVIVLSENASVTDNYAVSRLKYYLDEITGSTHHHTKDISVLFRQIMQSKQLAYQTTAYLSKSLLCSPVLNNSISPP